MNFEEASDELAYYTSDQEVVLRMAKEGTLKFEETDTYPIKQAQIVCYENGMTFISVKPKKEACEI